MVTAAFWKADPRTRGLSALAACIYLRATTESLIGVLQQSARAMASVHPPATEAEAHAAIDQLSTRGLARWWPEIDTLVVFGHALTAKGRAIAAAERELAQLDPEVAAYARGTEHVKRDNDSMSSSIQHEQEQVASLPLRLGLVEPPAQARKRKAKRDLGVEVEAVLARIDDRRVQLGDTPLAPYLREAGTIRARLNDDGVDLTLLLAIVDARAEDCRRNPGQVEWLNAVSPFTKGPEGRGGWWQSIKMLERGKAPRERVDAVAPFGVNPTTGKPYKSEAERETVERLRAAGQHLVGARKAITDGGR